MIGNRFSKFLFLSTLCVLSINCQLNSVNTLKRSIQSFNKEYVFSSRDDGNSSVVIAQPTKNGSFYYGSCDRFKDYQRCFVMEEFPLTDTASQTHHCLSSFSIEQDDVLDVKSNLYSWSDRNVLVTHEIYNNSEKKIQQLKILLLKMSDCTTVVDIEIPEVKFYQIFTTNEEKFDVLWTDEKGSRCSKYICRNTYDARGITIREHEIHARNTPRGNLIKPWTTLILGQENQYSYHVEHTWVHGEHGRTWPEYTIYRVYKDEMVKVFSKKYDTPYVATEHQELGLCDSAHNIYNNTELPEYNCLRYDLEGNVKLNFTIDSPKFYEFYSLGNYNFFNLKNKKLMIIQLGIPNYELHGNTYNFINPTVYRSDGQRDAPYNINLHQPDFTCSFDSRPVINVVEKEDEYCFQIICHDSVPGINNQKYNKIKLIMKCTPKNYYSIE